MKTQKKYEEYQKLYIKQNKELEVLEKQLIDNQEEIKKLETSYNEALKKADEVEAEKYFNMKIKTEEEQKKLKNRIKIKRDMTQVVIKEKKFETLIDAKNLSDLYKDDVSNAYSKLEDAARKFNEAIENINQINDAYGAEEQKYRTLLDSLTDNERKELRSKIGNVTNFNKYMVVSPNHIKQSPQGQLIIQEDK
ncbi:hypothetical protein ACMGE9_02585 [Macrococcus sp. EM39E]|uniref:hypothetical protein n=1 Tax=Macrococcus animalis TaxID=3395467 RepID=UPI0039BECB4B